MPYSSIFSGGSFTAPTKANPLAVPFVPGQYAKINAQIAANRVAPVDPNTIKDVPSLKTALKANQITRPQFISRINQLTPKINTNKYSAGNLAGAIGNAFKQTGEGIIKPPIALAKSPYDIIRGAAASATGNKKALANANKAKATDYPTALSPITRPAAVLAETIRHPNSAHTFTPKSTSSKEIFGDTPIQNIQAGVKTNYEQHKDLNPIARVALAGGYGAGQLAEDTAAVALGAKGAKDTGGVVAGVKKGATATKAATGKDKGVNQLIANTRAQNLSQAITKAQQSVPPPRSALDKFIVPAETSTTGSKTLARADAAVETPDISTERPVGTAKNPDIPEANPQDVIPKAGKFKNLISVSGDLSRQGASGKEIADRLAKVEDASETGQAQFLKKIPTVSKLKGGDFKNFVNALEDLSKNEGKTAESTTLDSLDPKTRQAVDEWTKAIPEVRKRAEAAGVDVGDLGKYYFPRNYAETLGSKQGLAKAAQHLVSTGQAKNLGDAVGKLKFMKSEYSRPFGHFERSRTLDLPDYDKSRTSLANYVSSAYSRIGHAEQFGPKGEVADSLIGNIGAEGRDADRALKNYQIATGLYKYHNPGVDTALSKVRAFNRVTKLGLSSILNATQSVNTAAVAGTLRTARAAFKQLSPAEREYVDSTGVRIDSVINALREQTGANSKLSESTNFVKKVIGKTLSAPGFGAVEKFNRGVAAIAGRDYARSLARRGSPRAVKVLQDKLGVEGDIGRTLTPEQEIQASRKIVELTQFKTGAKDLPGWADSPAGKTVAQFRTFSYKQTGFLYNQLIKEARRGNIMPLIRFVAVGVPIGIAAGGVRNELSGKPFYGDTKGQSTVKKIAGATYQGSSNVGGTGLAGTGAFLVDNYNSPNFLAYLAGDVGGPTAGLAASATLSRSQGATAEKRFALGQVPVAGPYLKSKYTPYGSTQQRAFDKAAPEDVAKTLVKAGYSPSDPSDARSKQLKTDDPKKYQQLIDNSNKLFVQKVTKAEADPAFQKLAPADKKKTLSAALGDARKKTLDDMKVKQPPKVPTARVKHY